MTGFWQDFRFSVRMARRRPMLTTIAVMSLTVGIAMTTVVFTLINAALLRPLAVEDPGRLAWITEQRTNSVNITLPWPDFVDVRRDQQVFTDISASSQSQFTARVSGRQYVANGEYVSASYFPLLEPRLRAGRLLGAADESPDAAVAVVSERLWRDVSSNAKAFSPLPLLINERPITIVGVVHDDFGGVWSGRRTDMWVPLSQFSTLSPGPDRFNQRGISWLLWIARLKPGVTYDVAAADLNRIESGLAPAIGRTPKVFRVTDGRRGATMGTASLEPTLRLLLLASAIVLLVACGNVANLLLARGAERRRELAVRTALGASRLRVLRLFLIEAGLIAGIAAVAGTVLAVVGASATAPLLLSFGAPIALDLSLDWRTLAFVGAIATLTTMVAGVLPAFGTSNAPTDDATRAATAGRRALRLRHGLLVLQFGCSIALVVSAVLLFRTVDRLRSQPTGFDTDAVALLTVSLRGAALTPEQGRVYLSDALDALRAAPGVEAAGYARVAPVAFGGSRGSLVIPGVTPEGEETEEINFNQVSAGYLEAMGITLTAGRTFTAADDRDQRGVIVNETMAERFWPDGAIGRTILWGPDLPPVPVIGVVQDAKYRMLREPAMPSFYVPMSMAAPGDGTFHVRVASSTAARLPELRELLTRTFPNVPVTQSRTLRMQAELNLSDDRLALRIGFSLAVAALLLAAVGLFGSMSFYVTQRTREFGVRVALGADATRINALVLRQGLLLAASGSVLGLVGTIWTARLVESRLFGVSAYDPVSLLIACGVLTACALLATVLPARRAARIDPMVALRNE